MNRLQFLKSALIGGASVLSLAHSAYAKEFDIPGGDLAAALEGYTTQAGVQIIYSGDAVRGHRSNGARGDYTEIAALSQVLSGTGFTTQMLSSNIIGIVRQEKPVKLAQAAAPKAAAPVPVQAGVETVVVTAQHKSENIQQVPIAVTALSQRDLTERQIAGGPDLVKEVPNLTFSKTNFSGYNLEIRGIGTQAISVTTDPAVAVAFNDTPFIRNHFFEQEFYDLQDAEVLRGPQGTLYGRNATAGVVNIKSALPTDTYEAMMSADMGNYNNRRLEAMINLPIVGDQLDIRIAGEWTKRDGYSENIETNTPIDGRDLWSGRMTLGWKPTSDLQTYFIWEHFSEDDDRLRSGKQLCKTDYGPGFVSSPNNPATGDLGYDVIGGMQKPIGPGFADVGGNYFTQGCLPNVSLYSSQAFEAPLGFTLPYILGLQDESNGNPINPYASETQSTNLRDIESGIEPVYRAKNDTLEFNANYALSPTLVLTSQTGYNQDFLFSAEDYNRFGATPGLFRPNPGLGVQPENNWLCANGSISVGQQCSVGGSGYQIGLFCDPQLGCSDRLELEDLSEERAWQLSQEFRLSSNFSGPLNFTAGANYLHYETVEYYYVFGNVLTLINGGYVPGETNSNGSNSLPTGFQYPNLKVAPLIAQGYVDPNSIYNLNNEGHNYFLSQNPYVLNSYAAFGEATYKFTDDLGLITGLRWTDDQKHFLDIPSWLVESGYGYPVAGAVNQQWGEFTGRTVINWTPNLDFTDQTLVYGSYAHGYKAGGANPPGAIFSSVVATATSSSQNVNPTHPLTFKPEFIEAFELGTKNTLLNGALTLNGDVFYYNYTGYQISEIVDRTAINTNYNAHVEGAELETNWEPAPGLKFGFTGGFEETALAGGDAAVDLMDRTAGVPGWVVVKPFVNEASNCIFPVYVAEYFRGGSPDAGSDATSYCAQAYDLHNDPLTGLPYVPNPTIAANGNGYGPTPPVGYSGFNPLTAPNNGAGFSKNLGGNQLPGAPHFTTSLTAEYTVPVLDDWAATFHTDLYWQSQQWARVFEDPIDKLHGYSNVNVALTLTSANGWEVMGYVKNVFDVTAITGTFLNSDDSGLTTNVFLTDPRLFGVRVTKHLDQGDGFWGSDYSGYDLFADLFADKDGGKPPLWIEFGGQAELLQSAQPLFAPPFFSEASAKPILGPMVDAQKPPLYSFGEEAKLSYTPANSDWVLSLSVRYGRGNVSRRGHQETAHPVVPITVSGAIVSDPVTDRDKFGDAESRSRESHLIVDFEVGKDVGLGLFGEHDSSVVSAGLRYAQFSSGFHATLHARPFYGSGPSFGYPGIIRLHYMYYRTNDALIQSKRSAKAIGPTISWDASVPVVEDSAASKLSFDWGLNAAVLFGRQRAHVHHQTDGSYVSGLLSGSVISHYAHIPPDQNRVRSVVIPNIGGFAGISWNYQNAKVSFGYRADEFFGAMDGGIDSYKSENRGFFGPFANISIGLGG